MSGSNGRPGSIPRKRPKYSPRKRRYSSRSIFAPNFPRSASTASSSSPCARVASCTSLELGGGALPALLAADETKLHAIKNRTRAVSKVIAVALYFISHSLYFRGIGGKNLQGIRRLKNFSVLPVVLAGLRGLIYFKRVRVRQPGEKKSDVTLSTWQTIEFSDDSGIRGHTNSIIGPVGCQRKRSKGGVLNCFRLPLARRKTIHEVNEVGLVCSCTSCDFVDRLCSR